MDNTDEVENRINCRHSDSNGLCCSCNTPCENAGLYYWKGNINHNYELLGQSIGALVDEKQLAYGDSFGKSGSVLKILFPDGIKVEQYDDVLCITRILDKLFRIANDKDAFGESPYKDIVGYGLLGLNKQEDSHND